MSEIDYDLLALSHPQKRIWYSEQLQPGTGMWNNAGTVKIFGEIDFNLLEQAVNIVIEKCESLRTRISDSKDVTLQYIQPFEYAKLELIDFSNKTTEEVYQWDREQSVVATKFVDSNLFYFAMLKLEHNQAGLYIRINHLISDAWSIVLLINHITETYDNLLLGDHLPISEFRPYTDYIDAEQAYLNSKRSQNDSNYWKEKYSVIPEFLSLKTKYDNVRENAAERKTYVTSGDIAKDVKEYCKTNRVSVFSFMVSLLGIYLHRITGKTDFVIGTSILNRVNEDEKNTFGMFVSTVPLRVTIDPEMPFREFHQSQATEIISSLRHQKYPYNLLMEEIRKNNRGVDSLFEITLSFQNASLAKDTTGFQYEVRWHSPLAQTNSLDIHLNDREGDDIFVWDYNYLTSLFSDSDIDLMQDYLANLLLEVLADPDIAVKDIKLMSEAQQQQLLQDMRGEQGKRQAAATLIEQFEDRVRRNPDAVTLITEQTQYTARQLDEKANGVAAYLMPLGAKVDQPIIVMMNKGHALISSILGILKSSAAFLPLAPETPAERVKVICRRCKARIAIVDKEYAEYFPKNVKVITSDEIKEIAPQPQALTTTHSPTSLAYIIFTSGTTGEPKGVMIENHSVARFVENYSDIMDMSEGITTLAVDSISFDIFIIEIFPALVGGAVLVLATDEESKLPDEIAKLVLDNNGNSFMCTPSRMSMLLSQCPPDTFYDIRQIMLGGEALSASLVKRFRELSKGRIYNFYGPTETTIGVTFKEITDEEINIGRPMQDVSAYILSDNLMLAPRGSTGELYIAGDCLARGYIGNQAETDRVFLPDPFNPGKRMYKTGDVVSLSDNNEIIYIGRSDSQVKIRGFRIELDEIQTRLFQIEGIDDCVVIDLENENKEKYLVAYICGDNTPTRSEIRTILGQSLPYYMVPAYFVRLPEIPLTTNGKLNRRALPEPDRQNEDIVITDRTVAPRTKTEILLADLWSHALGVKVNDRNDNFFELGGNSLNIIAVAAAVRSYFDLEVSLKEVYADPTLKAYAALIDKAVAGDEYIPIAKTELQRDYPASAAQRRVFMLRGIDDESIVYNMPGALRIQGKLDLKRLKAAYRTIVARHESLRTGIFMRGGELRQKVHAKVAVDIMSHSATHKQLPTMLKGFIQPFDISRPPLMRIEHVALSDDEHVLFIDMHHIISDGISYELVVSQLTDAYEGRALPEEKLRYTDYAVWQADFFTTLSMQRQKDYWQQQLGGELPQLSLRTDVPRHSHQQFIGKRSSFRITRRMQNDIHRFARSKALTPYTVMLSAFYIMLARYTSDEDIIIGTPSAGRNREELTDIVGMFVNTLALRTRPEGTKSCSDFMKEVQSTVLDGMVHQDYPFEYLLNDLNVKRDLSRNPIFDVFFSYNTAEISFNIRDAKVSEIEIPWYFSKFDITFDIRDVTGGMLWNIEYNELYKASTITRMATHYINILRSIIDDDTQLIEAVRMIDRNEEDLIIERLKGNYRDLEEEISPEETILSHALETPNKLAILTSEANCSFLELTARADSLAAKLISVGVAPGDIVVVSLARSVEIVASILAVLKVGATYLPIDPEYPKDRIEYMINDSNAKFAITTMQMPDKTIVIDPYDDIVSVDAIEFITKPDDAPAYLIYTSGSTGLPKGVKITRQNLLNYCEACRELDVFSKDDISVSVTTMSFDIFVLECLVALYTGATVAICNEEQQRVPSVLASFMNQTGCSFIQFTPSRLSLMLNDKSFCKALSSVKTLVIGGEALPEDLLIRVKKYTKARIINFYGPTETTVYSTLKDLANSRKVTIGKPVLNTQIYILDSFLNLVPEGVVGELYIGGLGVSPGYHNRNKLNSERFIPDPYYKGERIYRTGDLACLMSSDDILCLGRVDDQIKLGGHRIEPGEIERILEGHDEIEKAVVVVRDVLGDMRLCAYFLSPSETVPVESLRNHLGQKLPSYMVPNYFVHMERFPMTSSGKVDRKSLPAPEADRISHLHVEEPMTAQEKKIARVFKKILGVPAIRPTDDFFSLGGDSMSVIRVQIELLKLGMSISTQEFYEKPTIRLLCEGMNQEKVTEVKVNRRKYPAKVPAIKQPPFSVDRVLLTGATGYLGAHVLNELVRVHSSEILCVVRGKDDDDASKRLSDTLHFYFDKHADDIIANIIVRCGDISKGMSDFESFAPGTVINCAALTSHYGTEEVFNAANVVGVKKLIDYCKKTSANLCHISTTSVSGTVVEEADANLEFLFGEDDFYINQNINDNLYVKSKFEAENLIYRATRAGLNAKIMRVGNLMPRYDDGKFQLEPDRNAFMNRLKSYYLTGIAPSSALAIGGEFTPVDQAAKAIVLLLIEDDDLVCHVCNPIKTSGEDILKALEANLPNDAAIRVVEDHMYLKELKSIASSDTASDIAGLMEDVMQKFASGAPVILTAEVTAMKLESIGFIWKEISTEYLIKAVSSVK